MIYSTIWITAFAKVEGRQVAIKKIGDVFSDLVDAKRIVREIKLLRHFHKHENIVNIADIMTIPPGTTDFKDVYIVTNLMESDMDRIIASGQPLTDQHFQYFIYQVRFLAQLSVLSQQRGNIRRFPSLEFILSFLALMV